MAQSTVSIGRRNVLFPHATCTPLALIAAVPSHDLVLDALAAWLQPKDVANLSDVAALLPDSIPMELVQGASAIEEMQTETRRGLHVVFRQR